MADADHGGSRDQRAAPGRQLSEVLAGRRHRLDGAPALLAALALHDRADEDDPLALLAGDPRPVVGVGRVGQVLVLLELGDARGQQVLHPDAALTSGQQLLDRRLLGAVDDVLDHGAGGEFLEVEDLLVAPGVGHLQELVRLRLPVHPLDGALDHPLDGALPVLAVHGEDRQGTVEGMIQSAVERMYGETEENEFLEVTYASGDKEVLYFKDFSSGAMIQNIVDRAKKTAIKELLATGQRGIRVEHLLSACVAEFKENEDLPNTTNPDDWARISGKKGERIVFIRTIVQGKGGKESGRTIETVTPTGQYL